MKPYDFVKRQSTIQHLYLLFYCPKDSISLMPTHENSNIDNLYMNRVTGTVLCVNALAID